MGEFTSIDRDECLELLRTQNLGRFGVIVDKVPLMFPVNYVLDGDVITFRTAPGTKYESSLHNKVSFEVDYVAPDRQSGWSVLVVGAVDRMGLQVEDRERVEQLPIKPLAPGDKPILTRIAPETITGRRFEAVDSDLAIDLREPVWHQHGYL